MKKIAHIGFGAFHRAHQLVYAQALADQQAFPWQYLCVSLHSAESAEDIKLLREQALKFSILQQDATHKDICHIDVIAEALHPKLDGLKTILQQLSAPEVAIMTLTVTEKGYCMKDGFQALDATSSVIQSDLQQRDTPSSLPGIVANVLYRRMVNNSGPISILSCDNIPDNGGVMSLAIHQFIQHAYADTPLLNWLENNVRFPGCMVDRIVPAMTETSRETLEAALSAKDACGVVSEYYKQWVIEDNFINGRPPWELAGVMMVRRVAPYEEMKLRLLNGAHSWIAYVGYLAGCETVADVIEDEVFRVAVKKLMLREQALTLNMPDGVDVPAYVEALLQRFSNRQLQHRTWQIAKDGSQKLPQRWLQPLQMSIDNGRDCPMLELGIAAWLRYVLGIDMQDNKIDVRDPMLEGFEEIKKRTDSLPAAAIEILASNTLFSSASLQKGNTKQRVLEHFAAFGDVGIKARVKSMLA